MVNYPPRSVQLHNNVRSIFYNLPTLLIQNGLLDEKEKSSSPIKIFAFCGFFSHFFLSIIRNIRMLVIVFVFDDFLLFVCCKCVSNKNAPTVELIERSLLARVFVLHLRTAVFCWFCWFCYTNRGYLFCFSLCCIC